MTQSISDRTQNKVLSLENRGPLTVIPVEIVDASGTQITSFGGGSGVAIVDGADNAIKLTVKDLANSNPATVAIVDASGDQITSFGGGTQYTEGDTDATITGSALLMEGAANTLLPVQGTIADGLLINLGTNNDVIASNETNTIYAGTTALTPKFAVISLAASGDLIAAVSNKKLRVINIFLIVDGQTTITFQSGGSTSLTGAIPLLEYQGLSPGYDPTGHFQTISGEKLNLVLGTAVNVRGWLKYLEVP